MIRVLHVDDEPEITDLAAAFLEREDSRFTVETATSASNGLDQLSDTMFDCIISDYDMPVQNGIEFLKVVREDYPDLPFILYTGKGSEGVASDAISAGVTNYFQKQGETDQYTVLANRVQNAVEQYRSKQANQRYIKAFETAQEGISILNDAGEYIYVNEAYADLYEYDPGEMVGERWELIYLDDDTERVRKKILPTVTDEGFWHGETTGLRADGTTFPEDHVLAQTETGELICTVRDVTDKKAREQQLIALNNVSQELMTAESRDKIVKNGIEAARDVLGLEANAIYLHDADSGLVPVAYTAACSELAGDLPTLTGGDSIAWRVYKQGESLALEDIHDDPDIYNPETALQSELYLPLGDHGIMMAASDTVETFDQQEITFGEILAGSIVEALNNVERMDQLRAREQELTRQNDRLEEFTDIVSHDLRNPLNVAEGRLTLAQDECDSKHLDDVNHAIERMITLIDDLSTLAREGKQVGEREVVDIGAMAQNCWQSVATGDATLITESDRRIHADRSRVQQLFENLLRNAVEHGREDVTITIGALDDGFYVEDNGSGIPEDERDDVFETGYSTTEDGTGFGLSIVTQVAQAHGWDVHATEGFEGGARFEITGAESTTE